ncbi:carboxymuconolactone decarboxylase family protein [Undibacterium sp. TJN19]|uniref:carboxymuconolactone decarboxylase family protein n=1 Tax=Undibacterium sp. TJN19 TaxID=3413055 RepID=UPI003BF0EC97
MSTSTDQQSQPPLSLQPHQARIDWATYEKTAPAAVLALRSLGQAVDDSGLDKGLTELIKVRASQINGCAFCLQYHLNLARKLGLPVAKLDLLATWAETGIYSLRERAALAWTEALTNMNQQAISQAACEQLKSAFSDSEIAFLTTSIAAISAWNRIAGSLQFAPPVPAENLSGATK